jgi:ribosomal protein S6--L-glutamate ligase
MKKKFEYYSDFLSEAVKFNKNFSGDIDKSDVEIVLLSNISEESYTVPAVKKECKKKGVPFHVIDVNTSSLTSTKNGGLILADKDNSIEIDSDKTVILTRRGIVRNTHTRDIVERLEDANFFVVNTLDAVMNCENKWTTAKILDANNIPTPRTALINGEESIEGAVKKIGGKFPLILKMLSGSHGIGVSVIESEASLKSVLQTLWKVDPNIETLVQEKINSEYDLRIHVLTRKFNSPKPEDTDSVVLGFMKRNKIDKDFRTNVSLGGKAEKVKITTEQEQIAIDAAKAVGCNWAGVDIIVDKKTGKNYVLEVNSSPGTQGLKDATGVDVVKTIIDYLIDKTNWIRSRRVIGFREVITIPGLGDFVSKFDTGNGSMSCSITYDDINIADDKKSVKWTLGGKKFKHDVVGISNAEVGNDVQERVIIELDIIFGGKTYKSVPVSLVDRKEKSTKFLANRKFMERMGVSISPYKTFMVSNFEGDYSPRDAKGNNHMGIKFKK